MDERECWFNLLYEQNAPRMVVLATRLLTNRAVAEELTNEAFLTLLCKEQEVRKHPNPAGWLWETLKNLIRSELKSAKYRNEIPIDEEFSKIGEDIYQPPLSDALPAELAPKEREILLMLYEERLTYKEIGERLHITDLTCGARLTRARAHCKELISAAYAPQAEALK